MNGAGYGIAGAMGIYAKLLDQQNKDAKLKQMLGTPSPGAPVTPPKASSDPSWKVPGLDTPAQPAPNSYNGVAGSTNLAAATPSPTQVLADTDNQIINEPVMTASAQYSDAYKNLGSSPDQLVEGFKSSIA